MSGSPKPRILMVEDEALLLEVITADLEDFGFTVVQATTAESAMAILEAETAIDILFTDIRLPGQMDGWQLAEAARRLRPGLPVIYATGFSQTPPRLIEGSVFFAKPYRAVSLIKAIASFEVGPDAA
ncbi:MULTISPECIES: response regulator [unclassified Methylobacterium]|jgi:CheY-like chemotaxis protein|uniref:response regulator n=1 Tax=unclassified Methylobacterium TaxID=2615210 RepID=UPI0006FB8365|nr:MULTISPECIES: response regulator [unclassified Methylobacterium]KQP81774.1 response regulator receiver protein [Methylobacterium sp. Leaf113]KQP95434.1 response regulator receiver protein [Methylobacterium sp. Leaf117]MCK2055993.1 response regulator [Methylobacterium sp. 37f]